MLLIAGLATILVSLAVVVSVAIITTRQIPLSMARDDYRPPAMSWIKDSWIGDHWVGFNLMAGLAGLVLGLVTLFLTPYGGTLVEGHITDPDLPISFLAVESASMLGFHLVWSSALDWRYHKIPRWPLVFDMILQFLFTVTCVALSPNWNFLVLCVVLVSIMCWLMGTVPGSGMSDGRVYVLMACIGIPFMGMACWMPVVMTFILAIINAIVSSVTGGSLVHSERKKGMNMAKRILTAKSPMGPFVTSSFALFFILITTGLIHTIIF